MLTLAAPILALYAHDKVETETKRRTLEAAPRALRDAATQVHPKLDEMIDGFASELDAWVVKTGREMYRGLLEVLTAARAERNNSEIDQQLALSRIDQERKLLENVNDHLTKLRAALWGGERPASVPERPSFSE